jgi:CRISPR/Cas system-associated endonuclease Cas3-HD
MKGADYFKKTIQAYLEQRAANDELFAPVYANPDKNIDNCITYILNTVKASGCNGFADDEIYSMAMHYYDEPNIEVGKPTNVKVVVNHHIELTEEEKQQAHKKALQRATDEQYAKMTRCRKPAAKKAETSNQRTLF